MFKPILRSVPSLFVVTDEPTEVDAIVVLGGDPSGGRVDHASRLYQKGYLPTGPFIVSGGILYGKLTWAGFMAQRAIQNLVPIKCISLQLESETTDQNAEFSVKLLRKCEAKKVMIVTSDFHSKRTLALFRKHAPEIAFISCPSKSGFKEDWWKHAESARVIASEILKRLW